MYTITIYRNGRKRVYRFDTLEQAVWSAGDFFKRTGIIVGIEKED